MKLKLRRAAKSDLQKTYKWVNHDAVRKFSMNTQAVSFDSHSGWFLEKVTSKETAYYILENADKVALGSIRFDLQGETGKINYLLDPEYQGMGLGSVLLKKGMTAIKKDVPSLQSVYGWVFQANTASVKIFEKLKFQLIEAKDGFLKFEFQMMNYED